MPTATDVDIDGGSVHPNHSSTVYEESPVRPASSDKDNRSEKPEVSIQKDDPFLVEFDVGDPENPKNWSRMKRWWLTIASGVLVLNAAFASAAPSNILPQMMIYFGFGKEVASLIVSIFVVGYCVGPILWGPLSEQIGRRPVFLISFLFYTGFQVGCALSKNTGSILIFRFLGGTFAAAPLTNSGGVVSDIWDARTRGKGMTIFAVAPFAGPALGPTVAGWIAVSGTSWRWLFWVLTLFAGACFVLALVGLPETYPPVLLTRKAARIRKETGDDRYYSPQEAIKMSAAQRAEKILARPFKILFKEPVLIALTIYSSFLYGCMYLLFEAYPIVFSQDHHLNAGVSGLMFLPVSLGGISGCIAYLIYFNPRYYKYVDQYAPNPVPPETRLEGALISAPLYAISFFWFGWTSYSFISFWSSMMAGGLMGFSILLLFLSLMNYVVDVYLYVAASALASNTVVRSIFGAAFPLFARQMFTVMNPRWASTLLGAFASCMVPIPFVLRRYGPFLRAKSKYAPDLVTVAPQRSEKSPA